MRQKAHSSSPRQGRPRYAFVKVYHEDHDLIVVEKPAGLHSVKPPAGHAETIVDRVYTYLRRRFAKGGGSFVKPLHRLDVDTSGVMVLAKSRVGEQLEDQFRQHTILRRYLAVVSGVVVKDEGTIHRPLEKGEFGHGRKVKIAEAGEGLEAITHYRIKERYRDATLLEIEVKTGRTHQIRVHLASIGHPILGDKLYGSKHPHIRRHALHAYFLRFRHPTSGKKLEFNSSLPDDLGALVDQLRGL